MEGVQGVEDATEGGGGKDRWGFGPTWKDTRRRFAVSCTEYMPLSVELNFLKSGLD